MIKMARNDDLNMVILRLGLQKHEYRTDKIWSHLNSPMITAVETDLINEQVEPQAHHRST